MRFSLRALRNYFYAYFPRVSPLWYLAALALWAAVFVILSRIMGRSRREARGWYVPARCAAAAFCPAYVMLLLAMLVLSRQVGVRGLAPEPFRSYRMLAEGNRDIFYVVLFNILLFVPYGFAAGMAAASGLSSRRMRPQIAAVLSGLLVSLLLEFLQLRMNRGLAEFDDVFHNTLGTALGCAAAAGARGLLRLSDALSRKDREKEKSEAQRTGRLRS